MLELRQITKDYIAGETVVNALKGVSLTFRKSEFVSILGASGCGKTTMLNIVGGLDKYTTGDLIINGRTTKEFKDYDWDAYRNNYVGFVFQSYNLIPHQTVLGNVELALTLSGKSRSERKQKAIAALQKVGLGDQIHKKPNQLSGGQMQRVAIARAIVNDPSIILADEPTGALDSKTSVQIMEILKEIAKDRLIIMVTHNDIIADKYSTRIVRLKDGEVTGDTNPFEPTSDEREKLLLDEGIDIDMLKSFDGIKSVTQGATPEQKMREKALIKEAKRKEKERAKKRREALNKTSMKLTTALSLSGRNLLTKKGRTFMVSLAGSIGIIGIALVLAISNGFQGYIAKIQAETLSSIPLEISATSVDIEELMNSMSGRNDNSPTYPDEDIVTISPPQQNNYLKFNMLTEEYVNYVKAFDTSKVTDIIYKHNIKMNMLTPITAIGGAETIKKIGSDAKLQESLKNTEFLKTQYVALAGRFPDMSNPNEIVIIVDEKNKIPQSVADAMGFNFRPDVNYKFADFMGKQYKIFANDNYYDGNYDMQTKSGTFEVRDSATLLNHYKTANDPKDITLTVVGILRPHKDAMSPPYSTGILYTQALTQKLLDVNKDSQIVQAQRQQSQIPNAMGVNLVPTDGILEQQTYAMIIAHQLEELLPRSYFVSSMFEPIMPGSPITMIEYIISLALNENYQQDPIFAMLPQEAKDSIEGYLSFFSSMLPPLYFQQQTAVLNSIAGGELPDSINIYPLDFETKAELTDYLKAWNTNRPESEQISYLDISAIIGTSMSNLVNIIGYVLIAFAAVSLVVSSIMIAIITYVSVIERTKEIGVLRSIGARKKDISTVFNAETIIIGFVAGLLGVLVTYILTIPINLIINALIASSSNGLSIGNLAVLDPIAAIVLVVISTFLTLLSGLIPSRMAAKKDPVVALRSE